MHLGHGKSPALLKRPRANEEQSAQAERLKNISRDVQVLAQSVIESEEDGGRGKLSPSSQEVFGLLDRRHMEALAELSDLFPKPRRRDRVDPWIGIGLVTDIVVGDQQEPASRVTLLLPTQSLLRRSPHHWRLRYDALVDFTQSSRRDPRSDVLKFLSR